jgi:hypothetical protein
VPTAQLADAAEGSAAACSGLGCAQEAFDAVARPFAGLGGLIPNGEQLALEALQNLMACGNCPTLPSQTRGMRCKSGSAAASRGVERWQS